MIGPPGSGKTMLAKRIPSILPPMSFEEGLETTRIHSVTGLLPSETGIIDTRPFRSPHHTISDAGLVGGGSVPRPGEVSMAHNGVLFLDELPEFPRNVLEVIRNYRNELSMDRTINIESHVVEVIKELWTGEALALRAITSRLNDKYRDDFQESVSGKRIGHVVRKTLNIQTRRRAGVFEILPTEQQKLEALFRRFGLEGDEVSV
jgi:hypothetical protein